MENDVCRSRNITAKVKSRRLWWAGHVAWMFEARNA
jgi:hypothetical protein